jgi:uncharacterized surface protein with fasciclin (FAS1) repeats
MYRIIILCFLSALALFSCKQDWNAHYDPKEQTINTNVWDAIQKDSNLSVFVSYIKKYKLDSIFKKAQTYSLFIPTNAAFEQFTDSAKTTRMLLEYNIAPFYIQSVSISGKKKVQTLGNKFSLFERNSSGSYLDGILLKYESPLYQNGKYFTMAMIAYPKYNLYEFFAINCPVLKDYIDSKDSIIVDPKSRILKLDSLGRYVYDSIKINFNRFEHQYFPVSEEPRYKTATFVFPKQEDYNAALTLMAQSIGGNFHDYRDIPPVWQRKLLIPYLLEHGVFENLLDEQDFIPTKGQKTKRMKNILSDSVIVDYSVKEKTICSNGYFYNYLKFKVPDTLLSKTRFEAETLTRYLGVGNYGWKENVFGIPVKFAPRSEFVAGVSKDSLLKVVLPDLYTGDFSLTFNVDNLFPRKYLMVVRTQLRYGGKYEIYVNDKLVRTIDYLTFDDTYGSGNCESVDPNIGVYAPKDGFINFDCWVNNLTEFGTAKISFVYKGPCKTAKSGTIIVSSALSIDYIDFIPRK